eukprot:9358259-Pyramimonas_sp.AAC.1
MAYLWKACQDNTEFSDYLRRHVRGLAGSLILYQDECTPGNQQRPDHGRSVMCQYFTLKDTRAKCAPGRLARPPPTALGSNERASGHGPPPP